MTCLREWEINVWPSKEFVSLGRRTVCCFAVLSVSYSHVGISPLVSVLNCLPWFSLCWFDNMVNPLWGSKYQISTISTAWSEMLIWYKPAQSVQMHSQFLSAYTGRLYARSSIIYLYCFSLGAAPTTLLSWTTCTMFSLIRQMELCDHACSQSIRLEIKHQYLWSQGPVGLVHSLYTSKQAHASSYRLVVFWVLFHFIAAVVLTDM